MSSDFAIATYIRRVSIEHAERGLVLIILGIPISAIPIIGPVGSIIAFIGVVWYTSERELFGPRHSNTIVLAASLFVLGSGFLLVGSVGYLLFVLSSTSYPALFYWWYGNSAMASALAPSVPLILELETTGTILTGPAFFLLTYHPQERNVRGLLWLAPATNIILSLLEFSILTSSSSYHVLASPGFYPGGINFDDASRFQNQVLLVDLLSLIPALIYVATYDHLYSRIHNGTFPS